MSMIFNEICINEEMLPIYIYIYIIPIEEEGCNFYTGTYLHVRIWSSHQ